jgi:large subunit ribosomal protein L25
MAVAEQLKVEVRETRGKQAAKHLRQAGKIPGVVYSHGTEAIPVQVGKKDLNTLIRKRGTSALVELDGLPEGKTLAVYKQIQLHPVKYDPLHIDFQAVKVGEMIDVEVKIVLVGLPVGVDEHGGVLMKTADYVTISCTPANIPETIEVDVSHLGIGDAIHLGDAGLPDIFTLVSPADTVLASVGVSREAVSKLDEDEEGAGGAEGEGLADGEVAPEAD